MAKYQILVTGGYAQHGEERAGAVRSPVETLVLGAVRRRVCSNLWLKWKTSPIRGICSLSSEGKLSEPCFSANSRLRGLSWRRGQTSQSSSSRERKYAGRLERKFKANESKRASQRTCEGEGFPCKKGLSELWQRVRDKHMEAKRKRISEKTKGYLLHSRMLSLLSKNRGCSKTPVRLLKKSLRGGKT